jgi:hypothetical protein
MRSSLSLSRSLRIGHPVRQVIPSQTAGEAGPKLPIPQNRLSFHTGSRLTLPGLILTMLIKQLLSIGTGNTLAANVIFGIGDAAAGQICSPPITRCGQIEPDVTQRNEVGISPMGEALFDFAHLSDRGMATKHQILLVVVIGGAAAQVGVFTGERSNPTEPTFAPASD